MYQAQFSSFQSLSHVRLSATPWTAACQASLSFTNSRSLCKFMSIKLVTPFNHFILCRLLLLLPSTFPSIRWDAEDWLQVTSLVRLSMKELGKWIKPVHLILHLLPEMLQTLTVGKNYHRSLKGTEIRKLKTKKLKTIFSSDSILHIRWPKYWSFSINHSNEYSWLISSRIDWLDPLSVHGTLKSLLQHHSSKASIFQCSAFFMVQLSHPYTTTEKIIALTRWTLLAK